ncbi:hypothetical protein SDC9_184990 [bioreactor metagenome]|uniref:Uncharacterized protein n=1 Tax=bioreactor metagenome TaxID=1076179 RepID=A0A645HEM6_9ZZZZ
MNIGIASLRCEIKEDSKNPTAINTKPTNMNAEKSIFKSIIKLIIFKSDGFTISDIIVEATAIITTNI